MSIAKYRTSRTNDEAWKNLMSAVVETAVNDWRLYRDCDREDRSRLNLRHIRLRNKALEFLRDGEMVRFLGVVAPNISRGDVLNALGIDERTEIWEAK